MFISGGYWLTILFAGVLGYYINEISYVQPKWLTGPKIMSLS